MKKVDLFIAIVLAVLIFASVGTSQIHYAQPRYLGALTSAPATCVADTGTWYYNKTSDKFQYCSATNTWSDMGTGGGGGIGGTTGATDNAVLRADGTGGSTVQSSLATISDTGAITTPIDVTHTFGALSLVDNSGSNLQSIASGRFNFNISTGTGALNLQWNNNTVLSINQNDFTGFQVFKPVTGTASIAPIQFTAGTNLTTPTAGAMEYDGKVPYFDFAASQRGVVNSEQFVTNSSDTTLTNGTAAQSIFAAANDTLTVLGSTTYEFEALYYITTGATTHTTATVFGGTATLTSIGYWAELWSVTDGTINTTAPSTLRVATGGSTVLNATSAATATTIRLRGIIRTNAAGTLIPQIAFSADPTGTLLGKTNSYFRLWPVGSNSVVSVGPWN
jgi:hypothetical protein